MMRFGSPGPSRALSRSRSQEQLWLYLWRSARRLDSISSYDSRTTPITRVVLELVPGWYTWHPATLVRRAWRWLPTVYVPERRGDRWQRSSETLRLGVGDCEDVSILLGAVLKAMGVDVRIAAMPAHVALALPLGALPPPWDNPTLPSWQTYSHRGSRWLFLEATLSRAQRLRIDPGGASEPIARYVETPYLQISGLPPGPLGS